jgi:hypothetical protein
MWRVSESMAELPSSFSLYVMDITSSWMWQCGCWMQCGEVNDLLQLQIVGRCGRAHVGSRRGMKKAWLWGAPEKNGDRRAWKHPNWEFGGDSQKVKNRSWTGNAQQDIRLFRKVVTLANSSKFRAHLAGKRSALEHGRKGRRWRISMSTRVWRSLLTVIAFLLILISVVQLPHFSHYVERVNKVLFPRPWLLLGAFEGPSIASEI